MALNFGLDSLEIQYIYIYIIYIRIRWRHSFVAFLFLGKRESLKQFDQKIDIRGDPVFWPALSYNKGTRAVIYPSLGGLGEVGYLRVSPREYSSKYRQPGFIICSSVGGGYVLMEVAHIRLQEASGFCSFPRPGGPLPLLANG